MPATITTQTATYTRNRHDYVLTGSSRIGYDSSSIAAKRFAQALASLGMTISVVTDTTAEYDETLSPNEQPAQLYQAHVYDAEYNVGIYINSSSSASGNYNSMNYYGWSTYFRTGIVANGVVSTDAYTFSYCFDVGTWTITKQSFGTFVRYIFPSGSNSGSTSVSSGSSSHENHSTFVGNFTSFSAFKATNMLTGEAEPFCTTVPLSGLTSNYWFINTPRNTVNNSYNQTTIGHTIAEPQPSADKLLLWQTPLYCGGQLYDRINGGRLFNIGSAGRLPVGTDFTVDGVTLRALDTTYALELV